MDLINITSQSVLRTGLINPDLLIDEQYVRITTNSIFQDIIQRSVTERTKTPSNSKDLPEIFDLISQAIDDYQTRTHQTEDNKIHIIYGYPEKDIEAESITIGLEKREPGAFSQGPPFEGPVKNLKPIVREVIDDPDNLGYKRATLGYYYDNLIKLTCWARTNKKCTERAIWLENLMEEYSWFFAYSGVNRLIYWGQQEDIVRDVRNNNNYGRPLRYFIRTEKITHLTEKSIEQILINIYVNKNGYPT